MSDILPYELPISFTNRHFYKFLIENGIEMKGNIISYSKTAKSQDNIAFNEIIKLLFGTKESVEFNSKKVKNATSIPFSYEIFHKGKESRTLTIPHPLNQLSIIDFYDKYKEVIIYYATKSSFSIRKPIKLAKYKFYKDKTHYQKLEKGIGTIEEKSKEYQNLSSFFTYYKYKNIYKFYESYKYHRCEKKYEKLMKLDIAKCFDSIYTHSLPWAILGKDKVKDCMDESKGTFAGKFDKLMRDMNHGETNGIVIGPEVSRIFSELILQSVDQEVEEELQQKFNLQHKVDYEIFRYIDDYFIFYNSETDIEEIFICLQRHLRNYKLHMNMGKQKKYDKPFVTEISIAKERITSLLDKALLFNQKPENNSASFIFLNSNKLIKSFKIILKESDVSYQDVLNYTLATVERKIKEILGQYKEIEEEEQPRKQLVATMIGIIEFCFFIYSNTPKVNTTIRLCGIIKEFHSFLMEQDSKVDKESRHLVFKSVYENSTLMLKKNKTGKYIKVETLYLLIALSELGGSYFLEENVLANYFNISRDENGKYISKTNFNYLSYTVILLYMKNHSKYSDLKEYIEKDIMKTFDMKIKKDNRITEVTLLMFDMIACPYIKELTKKEILTKFGVEETNHDAIINYKSLDGSQQLWFTTWLNFDFAKELEMKKGQEVY